MKMVLKNKIAEPFASKGGHGGIWAILIGILILFIIRWIAPVLIASCVVFGAM